MTPEPEDDLDLLRAALKAAPVPNQAEKAEAIARAMKNFDALQGSRGRLRSSSDTPRKAGGLSGVRNMLNSLKHRGFLAATTSVAALVVLAVTVGPQLREPAPSGPLLPSPVAGPLAEPAAQSQEAPEVETPADAPLAKLAPEVEALVDMAEAPRTAAPSAAAPEPYGVGLAMPEAAPLAFEDTEAFANATPNAVKITLDEPVSTFSIDVDTASYAVVRNSLMRGELPLAEAVRVEEMVNYFPYSYPAPEAGAAPFRPTVSVLQTPWNPGTKLVHIGIQGRLPAIEDRPPLNLVFLIDTSGSMDDPAKLPLLRQSFRLMLSQLRPEDEVAIIAYAGSAGEVLPPTRAEDRATILAALERLDAGGTTAGGEGLELAYQLAAKMSAAGEVSRVLLATDGDFNVGISDPEALAKFIAKRRDSGIYLSVLGFGRGNLDDATMQALAQNGNGMAAYIDTLQEARKVLVDQLSGALFPIADDVKIQVEWNPSQVAEYRLIGYETRALRREDFNNDKVDAGEIGAGHSVTAIYEVTAPDSPALRNDPLRYQPEAPTDADAGGELGFLRLRYKAPGEEISALIETPILPEVGQPADDARFSVAIAGFGQLLTGASYLGDWGWDEAIQLAEGARGDDPFGYRIEAVNLMRLAQTLAN